MKQILFILLAGIFSLGLFSCYDDKGSYDYHEINEITISNWPEDGYSYLYRDTLRITPQFGTYDSTNTHDPYVQLTLDDGNPERYEYSWKVIRSTTVSSESFEAEIGTERNLEYPISIESGTYTLYYKIKDLETGLQWLSNTTLTVQNSTDQGFLVLGEKEDGTVGLDMISFAAGDTLLIKGLLDNNGLPALQGPKRIMYTGSYSSERDRVWMSTESGSFYFDPSTMQTSEANTFDVFNVSTLELPSPVIIEEMSAKRYFGLNAAITNRIIVTEDYVFACQLGQGELYGNPLNCYDATTMEYFKPFPYVFVGNYMTQSRYIIYDEDNHRFVYFTNGLAQTVTQFGADAATDPFPWQQPEDRELIYGENSCSYSGTSTYSFALLKDADNFYVYQFLMGSTSSKTNGYEFAKSDAPNLDNATLFAFASSRPLLLYADGSTLRAYDYANNRSYSLEMDGEITCMEFDFLGNMDEIMIATYNDTEQGVLERYQLGSTLTTFELEPLSSDRWTRKTGLVKVKDIEYKN